MEINYDRVRLSFDMVGSQDTKANGDKPPIIFLHGMTSTKETWRNIIRPVATATGRKTYAFDARNHGDTGWSDQLDYEMMVEDLLQFIDSTHSQKAILVGHSMGGKTAMHFATRKPARVEKLIVEDMSPSPVPPHLRFVAKKYVQLLQDAIETIPLNTQDLIEANKIVYEFMQKNTAAQNQSSSRREEEAGYNFPLFKDENGVFKWKTNLKAIGESFLSSPILQEVTGSFPGPTLILYGTKSPYKVSADRDYIRRVFPQAQLRAIEDATHQIHDEFGDLFIKEIVDFINDS